MEGTSEKQHQTEPEDSLFAQEQRYSSDVPWWQRNFLLTRPVLFGTWDGVFTTVMVNIFGIIVFLRMGWIVGTAGIANAILLLIICTTLALIPVFSAIGICERCQIQSGGIYFLISHVLGGQIGGAVGLMYAFGQAVATGLVVVGFGESIAKLFGTEDMKIVKLVAAATLLILTAINTAGVRWVIRLQLLLLGFLSLAVLDFFLGVLFTLDEEHGVGHISTRQFELNTNPMYDGINCSKIGFDVRRSNESFFTVFGVFFANFLGVLAGVNMSGDLKDPHKSIPVGELVAVGVSSTVCFFFIIALGAVADRAYLLCDSLIAEKVSLTGFLFLTGLYISSLSSTIGSLLGTPRVIQSIAAEGVIPILNPLAAGQGPNNNPVRAGIVMMMVAIVFVMLGDLNQLAILSTMPFMITYAFVNYSYVSLAMSYDLQSVNSIANASKEKQSYGSMGNLKGAAEGTSAADLDSLFPERMQHTELGGEHHSSVIGQPSSWYSMFSSRYISFIGAIVNILILLFVNIWFALFHFAALAALYLYIGHVCPSVFPGISHFSLPHMFKTAFSSIESLGTLPKSSIVVATGLQGATRPDMQVSSELVNEENPDYSDRKQYHHTGHADALNDFD